MAKLAICRERGAQDDGHHVTDRGYGAIGKCCQTRKWVKNVGFATRAILGAREQDRGCAEREVGRVERSLKTRETQ
jgi:hypothetical protein